MNTVLLLKLRAQLELAITNRECMIAENKQREITGQSMGYNDNDFVPVIKEMESIISELQGLLNYGIHE